MKVSKKHMRTLKKALERFYDNVQQEFDEMELEEYESDPSANDEATCLQCTAEGLIDEIDMYMDNN